MLTFVWLEIQMNVLVVLKNPFVGERRAAPVDVTFERFLLGMMNDFVALHFVRVNEHRALVADDFLVRGLLLEEAGVPEDVVLDLLAVVELGSALVTRKELLAMRVQVKRELFLRRKVLEALVALERVEGVLSRWIVSSKMCVKIF